MLVPLPLQFVGSLPLKLSNIATFSVGTCEVINLLLLSLRPSAQPLPFGNRRAIKALGQQDFGSMSSGFRAMPFQPFLRVVEPVGKQSDATQLAVCLNSPSDFVANDLRVEFGQPQQTYLTERADQPNQSLIAWACD